MCKAASVSKKRKVQWKFIRKSMTLVATKEERKAEVDIRRNEGMEAKVLVLVVGATHLYEFKF